MLNFFDIIWPTFTFFVVENGPDSMDVYNEVTTTIPIFRVSSYSYSRLTNKITISPENTFTLKNSFVKPDVSFEHWKFTTVKHWGESVPGFLFSFFMSFKVLGEMRYFFQ